MCSEFHWDHAGAAREITRSNGVHVLGIAYLVSGRAQAFFKKKSWPMLKVFPPDLSERIRLCRALALPCISRRPKPKMRGLQKPVALVLCCLLAARAQEHHTSISIIAQAWNSFPVVND